MKEELSLSPRFLIWELGAIIVFGAQGENAVGVRHAEGAHSLTWSTEEARSLLI